MNATCELGLQDVCDSSMEKLDDFARGATVIMTAVAMLAFVLGGVLHQLHVTWLPESLVVVCFGMVLGFIFWLSPLMGPEKSLDERLEGFIFGWVLKLFALPIIIFESGWSLRLRDFTSQLGYIMLFAIVGTLFSVVTVASLMVATSNYHGVKSRRTAIAYAALISSVDPVATLSTFGQLTVDPLLFILVFGESQINDAVAITLFEAVNKTKLHNVLGLLLAMLQLLAGSISMGLAVGVLAILMLRAARLGSSPAHAILFIFISCFFTFSLAESAGGRLSGIITVLFYSIFMGQFASGHLSAESMSMASFLLRQTSSLADTLIFMFCGVQGVFVVLRGGQGLHLSMWVIGFCLVGRFVAVVPMGIVSNVIKRVVARRLPAERKIMISPAHLFMMWHSGLRGGVSLVLALEMGEWVDEEKGDAPDTKDKLINATFVLIVVYLLVFGSTTGLFLRLLGLPMGQEANKMDLYDPAAKSGRAWRGWKRCRKRYLNPVLVGRHRDPSPSGDGILTHVLSAGQGERSTGGNQRHRPAAGQEVLSQVFNLFGEYDPGHVQNRIMDDTADSETDSEVDEEEELSSEEVAEHCRSE